MKRFSDHSLATTPHESVFSPYTFFSGGVLLLASASSFSVVAYYLQSGDSL